MTFRIQIPEFQSLIGRLKTWFESAEEYYEFVFQSLIGRLKTS